MFCFSPSPFPKFGPSNGFPHLVNMDYMIKKFRGVSSFDLLHCLDRFFFYAPHQNAFADVFYRLSACIPLHPLLPCKVVHIAFGHVYTTIEFGTLGVNVRCSVPIIFALGSSPRLCMVYCSSLFLVFIFTPLPTPPLKQTIPIVLMYAIHTNRQYQNVFLGYI